MSGMPYWLVRISNDINKSLYDIKVEGNPLFRKIRGIITQGRLMPNKQEQSDLIFIDEQKLLKLKKYLNENSDEVVKSLNMHNKSLKKIKP